MANDIILVSEEAGFMMMSVVKNLYDNSIVAEIVEPYARNLASKMFVDGCQAYMILLYAGDYLENAEDLLLMIKELCESHERMFGVIGYKDEFETIKKYIPEHLISCEIERPFVMAELIKTIKLTMSKGVKKSRKKSILLVDDSVTFLNMMQKWLSINYEVTTVKSGTQAIAYLASNTPDLILLDFDMPVLSGPQVMQTIRSESKCPDVPIIFLTGKSDRESVMEVMALKPQGYILKSGAQADILKTVDTFFEKHPSKKDEQDVMLM